MYYGESTQMNVIQEFSFMNYKLDTQENLIKQINRDLDNKNPTVLDKLGRILMKDQPIIFIIGTVRSGGVPILLPITLLGAAIDVVIVHCIAAAITGKEASDIITFYKKSATKNIDDLEQQRRKFLSKGDKDSAKRCDQLINENKKIIARCEKENKKISVKEECITNVAQIYESTKLI